ncbi:MAG: hypothetical protein R3B48_12615 [Kofleriaceae bacterium]
MKKHALLLFSLGSLLTACVATDGGDSPQPPADPDGDPASVEPSPLAEAATPQEGSRVDADAPLVVRVTKEESKAVGDISVAATATIHGQVVFNDRRNHGLFAARRGLDKVTVGSKCGTDGLWPDGTSCATHWLAAQYMVVDIYERDTGFGPFDTNCKDSDKIGSATVNYDGTFTATFSVSDACNHDDYTRTAITLRARTKFCGADWCFSVDSSANHPYELAYPGAGEASPLLVSAGDNITLGAMAFHPGGTSSTAVNDYSIAANLYASLVDTVLTVHRDAGVPFYKDEYGELQYLYPSTQTSTATALSPTRIVDKVNTSWDGGLTPAHEYGHILMQRAWGGSYGFNGVGISAGDGAAAVSQQIAFKEAWAEFIAHAVFPLTNGCELPSFDDNSQKPGSAVWGALGEGTWWRLNVTKSLCDWHDARYDNDPALAGPGDSFSADLYSMWYNLRRMYLDVNQYGGDFSGDGLYFCDYVSYYLDVRKSVAAVGTAEHNAKVSSITNVIYNNNIACFLPAP